MSTEHSPGPWVIGPRGAAIYGPDNLRIASVDRRPERAANARLIAAAPALLAACRAMVAELETHGCLRYELCMALGDAQLAIASTEDLESVA